MTFPLCRNWDLGEPSFSPLSHTRCFPIPGQPTFDPTCPRGFCACTRITRFRLETALGPCYPLKIRCSYLFSTGHG